MRLSGRCNAFLRCLLKFFNFFLAFIGVAVILYSIWAFYTVSSSSYTDTAPLPTHDINMFVKSDSLNLGQTDLEQSKPFGLHHGESSLGSKVDLDLRIRSLPSAWFTCLLFGLGAAVCLIAFVGHVAAETSNSCCLTSYTVLVILSILLQAAFVANVYFNENWEEIIPSDSTGVYDSIKEFVEDNFEFCKWVGLGVVIVEAITVLLAMSVRAVTPNSGQAAYNSNSGQTLPRSSIRQPFLVNRQASNATSQNAGTVEGWPSQPGAWSLRMREKYGVDARTGS